MMRAVWQGIGVGAVLALLILIVSAFAAALRGELAGIVVAGICLLATVGGLARWVWLDRRDPPAVVNQLPEVGPRPPWAYSPARPPSERFDPKVVIAAVEASRLGHRTPHTLSMHEMHAVAVRCDRQGQLVPQIARTLRRDPKDVEWLLSFAEPALAWPARSATWGQA